MANTVRPQKPDTDHLDLISCAWLESALQWASEATDPLGSLLAELYPRTGKRGPAPQPNVPYLFVEWCTRRLVAPPHNLSRPEAAERLHQRYGSAALVPHPDRELRAFDDFLERIRARGWRVPPELELPTGTLPTCSTAPTLSELRREVEAAERQGDVQLVAEAIWAAEWIANGPAHRQQLEALGIPAREPAAEHGVTAQAEAKRLEAQRTARENMLRRLAWIRPRLGERCSDRRLLDAALSDDRMRKLARPTLPSNLRPRRKRPRGRPRNDPHRKRGDLLRARLRREHIDSEITRAVAKYVAERS
jgi:hypothetical protein